MNTASIAIICVTVTICAFLWAAVAINRTKGK